MGWVRTTITRGIAGMALPTYRLGNIPGLITTIWDPITNRSTSLNVPVRVTVHITAVHSSDIYGPGMGPGGSYAHFHNARNGELRQHQEIHHKTYATGDSNGHEVSVEDEGVEGDVLTSAQILNLGFIFAHCVKYFAVPNRIATFDDPTGLAWHRLGVDGNFGAFDPEDRKTWCRDQTGLYWSNSTGKTCPTD